MAARVVTIGINGWATGGFPFDKSWAHKGVPHSLNPALARLSHSTTAKASSGHIFTTSPLLAYNLRSVASEDTSSSSYCNRAKSLHVE